MNIARLAPSLLFALLLVSCASERTRIRGALEGAECEEVDAHSVSVVGEEVEVAIEECGFEVETERSGETVLVFARKSRQDARMHIEGLPPGARLDLRDVYFDSRGLAFPTMVESRGVDLVQVNGIRMASRGHLPRSFDGEVTVLAISDDVSALLARPLDASLPDLRVRVDSAAETVIRDGTPTSLRGLSFGDSIRIEGLRGAGFIQAHRIIIPNAVASRIAEGTGRGPAATLWHELERLIGVIGGVDRGKLEEEARRRGIRLEDEEAEEEDDGDEEEDKEEKEKKENKRDKRRRNRGS